MNVLTVSSNVPPDVLYLTPMKNFVDSGKLPSLANTTQQIHFFARNRVSRLLDPFLPADAAGYNSGNYLTGIFALHCSLLSP